MKTYLATIAGKFMQPNGTVIVRIGKEVRTVGLLDLYNDEQLSGACHAHEIAILCNDVYMEEDCNDIKCNLLGPPDGWERDRDVPAISTAPYTYSVRTLKYEVWSKKSENLVVIVFRGTVFKEFWDWYTNFRWVTRFIPRIWDHYDQVRDYIPKLVPSILERYGPNVKVIAAGHSLGGGLAQQAAYASPYIKKAYAFNSSPVTGWKSVRRCDRIENSKGIFIYRIYEKGEILAYLRFLIKRFYKASTENPRIIEMRCDFSRGMTVKQHSMRPFAEHLYKTWHPNNGNG